jgi:hypothetical protein
MLLREILPFNTVELIPTLWWENNGATLHGCYIDLVGPGNFGKDLGVAHLFAVRDNLLLVFVDVSCLCLDFGLMLDVMLHCEL